MFPSAMLEKILTLSEREYQIFVERGRGRTNRELTQLKGFKCSGKTIEAHLYNIKRKLELENNAMLWHWATKFEVYCEENKVVRVDVEKVERRRFEYNGK